MLIIKHVRDNFAAAFFPRRSEWAAASVLLALGWMLSVNDTLMRSATTKAYSLLLLIASQQVWASTLIVFASIRLTILLINGAWRRSPHARGITAFLSCFFWTQMVLSFAPTLGYAFILASGWLVTDMLNILYAFRDARTVDHSYAVRRQAGERQ